MSHVVLTALVMFSSSYSLFHGTKHLSDKAHHDEHLPSFSSLFTHEHVHSDQSIAGLSELCDACFLLVHFGDFAEEAPLIGSSLIQKQRDIESFGFLSRSKYLAYHSRAPPSYA